MHRACTIRTLRLRERGRAGRGGHARRRPGRLDGRAARSAKTRDAIADALLDLLAEGKLRPTAAEIADRAAVSRALGVRPLRRPRRPLLRRGQPPLRPHRADARARRRDRDARRTGAGARAPAHPASTPRPARSARATRLHAEFSPTLARILRDAHARSPRRPRTGVRARSCARSHDPRRRRTRSRCSTSSPGPDAWQTLRERHGLTADRRDAVRDRFRRRAAPGGRCVTAAFDGRDLGPGFDSGPRDRAVAVVAASASPPSRRTAALSPVGVAALALAAVPFALREFRGRVAFVPVVPLLFMYALADGMWHPPMSFVLEGVIAGLLTSLLARRNRHRLPREPHRELRAGRARCASPPTSRSLLIVARHWNYFLAAGHWARRRDPARRPRRVLVPAALLPRAAAHRHRRDDRHRRSCCSALSFFLPSWIGKPDNFKLPNELSWSFHVGVTSFDGNEILVSSIVPLVLVALVGFFRFSAIGTALRATAESADRAVAARDPRAPVAERRCGRSSACSRTSRSSCATA